MKKAVKTLALSTILLLQLNLVHAQLKLNPLSNAVGNDLKKVIEDYPSRFANLMDEMIVENPQSTEYKCRIKVNGEEESSITRYSSRLKSVCSWQAVMLTTESFEKAKQKFKTLFNQLNNLSVNPGGAKTYHLKGVYEAPVEVMKFASVIFSFSPDDENIMKLKVEVSLQFELTEWKVKLLVYDREREDEERGKTIEE
jgi:hypothetical protein